MTQTYKTQMEQKKANCYLEKKKIILQCLLEEALKERKMQEGVRYFIIYLAKNGTLKLHPILESLHLYN